MSVTIRLHTWPTPNGHKVHILLEELGLPYEVVPVNIGAGEQFRPEFLALTPNHRIPAMEDPQGPDGQPIALFESAAIMIYLAEKTGSALLPASGAARHLCLQWLMFQMGGVGPMFGQYGHFATYAPEKIPYAITRYTNEVQRLHRVTNFPVETQSALHDYRSRLGFDQTQFQPPPLSMGHCNGDNESLFCASTSGSVRWATVWSACSNGGGNAFPPLVGSAQYPGAGRRTQKEPLRDRSRFEHLRQRTHGGVVGPVRNIGHPRPATRLFFWVQKHNPHLSIR